MSCPHHRSVDAPAAGAGALPACSESLHIKQSTPGPEGLISHDEDVDPLMFLGDLIERYGDVARYQTRFGPCFLFVHPEHVQAILHNENYRRASLVKMMLGEGVLAIDGPRWRSQRRLMQRDFLPPSIGPLVEVMTRETARAAVEWEAVFSSQQSIDVTGSMTRLTLRIIVQALFSDALPDEQVNGLCNAVTETIVHLGNISRTVFGVPMHFTPSSSANFAAAKKVIDTACYDMINRRRAMAAAERPDDLLTMLIAADTETGPMTDRQLRDEIVTLFVGGHETTALVMGWAWKEIAEHPEIEAKLHQEVDEVLGGRPAQLADLAKLTWSRAIFQEAMRLYPPVWYMARVASEDDTIGGHAIPRGANVLVSQWFTHRHKDFWTNPQQFDPSRFLDPKAKLPHRYAYFPFGGGRHQCLGMHFALLEGTLILAQLSQQFRVLPIAGQQIKPDPGITLRQSPAMLAQLQRRKPQATGKCTIGEAA